MLHCHQDMDSPTEPDSPADPPATPPNPSTPAVASLPEPLPAGTEGPEVPNSPPETAQPGTTKPSNTRQQCRHTTKEENQKKPKLAHHNRSWHPKGQKPQQLQNHHPKAIPAKGPPTATVAVQPHEQERHQSWQEAKPPGKT